MTIMKNNTATASTTHKDLTMSVLALTLLLVGLFIAANIMNVARAAESTESDLFVLTAKSAEIKPVNGHKNHFALKLEHATSPVTYFADRPIRQAGKLTLKAFMNMWKDNKLDVRSKQPNVSVVGYAHDQNEAQIYVFKVKDPKLDVANNTISFNAVAISANRPVLGKMTELHHVSVFIDDVHWHGNKFKPHNHGH